MNSEGFTYRLYRLKPRASRSKGASNTLVRIESMAGVWSFGFNFVKNLCLNYYSRNLVLFNFRGDNAKSSNEFPWISIWRLVKPHANYCVDILKARWLRPAFAESYRLLRVTLSKELVAVFVWNAPDQWHKWRVAGMRITTPAKLNVKTVSRLACILVFRPTILLVSVECCFLRFSECFPVISGFYIGFQYRIFYCFSTIFWVLASGLPSAKFLCGSNL